MDVEAENPGTNRKIVEVAATFRLRGAALASVSWVAEVGTG
jgi:hypothetical protein